MSRADAKSLATQHWDAIVIGTGMGGGTIGRALSEAGAKVLFLEFGRAGLRREAQGLDHMMGDPVARMVRGYWPTALDVRVDGIQQDVFAPLGAGVGGSSVFYAGTLERPARHDLEDLGAVAHPTGGWPVGFSDFEPWFRQAERMFELSGTQDPLAEMPSDLRPGPEPSAADRKIAARLEARGMHPYQSHQAVRDLPGCQSCLGRKCPRACKLDARSAGVEPALATGNAQLIDQCRVTRLIAKDAKVTGVEAIRDGEAIVFHAQEVILAAGALNSPRLLMASANDDWPDGLGNRSGLVGRNLMFHGTEMFAVWPGVAGEALSKSVALRDLYMQGDTRLGMVQAMGITAGYGEILHYLRMAAGRSRFAKLPGLNHLLRIPAAIGAKTLGQATVFAGILEDLPYPENRVTTSQTDPDRIRVDYQISDEFLTRRRAFRKAIRRAFGNQRMAFLTWQPDLNLGHSCGTLRFGHDPMTSVLDENCRVHGLQNLTVADASFMPSSMGVNPSLTIAANALRVGSLVTQRLGMTSKEVRT